MISSELCSRKPLAYTSAIWPRYGVICLALKMCIKILQKMKRKISFIALLHRSFIIAGAFEGGLAWLDHVQTLQCPRPAIAPEMRNRSCRLKKLQRGRACFLHHQIGLVISGQVNWLTGKIHLTTCSGKNILFPLKKSS